MPYWKIPAPIVLRVTGPHAVRYANARLTNDIVKLEVGSGCLAAALTPQGKTEGFFSVFKVEPETLLLFCDGGDHEKVTLAFKRYLVADKVEVIDESDDWVCFHATAFPGRERSRQITSSAIAWPRKRWKEPGFDVYERKDTVAVSGSKSKEKMLSDEEAKLARIQAGVPSFPENLNEERLFIEANLREAVSDTKGCYTGQEVVERIASRGKTPRILVVGFIEGTGSPELGAAVKSAEGVEVGEVIEVAVDVQKERSYVFISLKNSNEVLGLALNVNRKTLKLLTT